MRRRRTTPHENEFSEEAVLSVSDGWQIYLNGKRFSGDFHAIPLQAHPARSPCLAESHDTTFAWNGL
jgi:hypothetical protein